MTYLLAKANAITVNGQSQGILTVLVFGAGTDYALLLIARYREELRRHESRHEAMGVALRRSFPAILASGATVAISLLCLLFAELNNIRGLGPVGAIGIASGRMTSSLWHVAAPTLSAIDRPLTVIASPCSSGSSWRSTTGSPPA